jgi:hypothetical protein
VGFSWMAELSDVTRKKMTDELVSKADELVSASQWEAWQVCIAW